jgi:pyrroline-5-carboxylate reductase
MTGCIGLGSMHGTLLRALLAHCTLAPAEVIAGPRSRAVIAALAADYPGLTIAPDNHAVALASRILFLGVRPVETLGVLDGIAAVLPADAHLVSMCGSPTMKNLATRWPGKLSRTDVPASPEPLSGQAFKTRFPCYT